MADTVAEPTRADALWRRLARTGQVRELYRDGDPAAGVDAAALRALFRRLDDDESVGATLGVCVQATTALPLLAAAARRSKHALQPLSVITDAVLNGEQMVGLAATDSTPGSDLTALTTAVTIEDDHLMLSGSKQWTANATYATHLLVLARHSDGPGFANFTWVVVPVDAPGVTVEAAPASLFSGSGTGHAAFREVSLPLAYLGSAVGRGLVDFSYHISVERLASATWGHAMCKRVLRDTVDYLRRRGEGPANLWGKEDVRRRIAKCLLSTAQLGTLIDRCERDIVDRHDALSASLVKASAAQTVDEVLSVASHLQGAQAFVDGGLQTLRAQAGLWSIGGGTYEVMLSTIADHTDRLLGWVP
jgi:citronellyl-CoA dehydrogenase